MSQEAAEEYFADYTTNHSNRVYSFRTERQHLAGRSDASQLMSDSLESAVADIAKWMQPTQNVEANIKVLTERLSHPAAPQRNTKSERLCHGTRLLLFCRELADSITEIRRVAIGTLQEPLQVAWDIRSHTLSELDEAISTLATASVSLLDAPWESRLPTMSARDDVTGLLASNVSSVLRMRLHDFVASLIVKVQRPLPVRPRGARDQCQRVLVDLRDLLQYTGTKDDKSRPMSLENAWMHLPCVLWSETYAELILRVNTDNDSSSSNSVGKRRAVGNSTQAIESKEKRVK